MCVRLTPRTHRQVYHAWLAALCVKRPVFADVLILSLTVIGAFSFTRLGVDRFPRSTSRPVLVTDRPAGGAPEHDRDGDSRTRSDGGGQHHQRTSTSFDRCPEGISQVIVSFVLEKETDVAAQECATRCQQRAALLRRTISSRVSDKSIRCLAGDEPRA